MVVLAGSNVGDQSVAIRGSESGSTWTSGTTDDAGQRGVIDVHRHPLVGAEQPKARELHLPRQKHVAGGQSARARHCSGS